MANLDRPTLATTNDDSDQHISMDLESRRSSTASARRPSTVISCMDVAPEKNKYLKSQVFIAWKQLDAEISFDSSIWMELFSSPFPVVSSPQEAHELKLAAEYTIPSIGGLLPNLVLNNHGTLNVNKIVNQIDPDSIHINETSSNALESLFAVSVSYKENGLMLIMVQF
jgi:hypothetical protein